MGLCEPLDTTNDTHRVVTRTEWESDDEVTDWVGVENAVVEVAMRYGTAVHLTINGPNLEELAPETLDTVRRLTRLRESEQLIAHGRRPEYRATLPDDAGIVRECLAVTDGIGAGAGAWRAYDIHEIAVVTNEEWLYHSIPHHALNREVNASVEGFLEALDDRLDSMRGSAVFAIGPIRSWQVDGREYELDPEYLRVGGPKQRRTGFSLARLVGLHPCPERLELGCRWHGLPETDSSVIKSLRWIFGRFSTDPPETIEVPDHETLDEVLDGFITIATKLDYDYTVHD